MQHCILEAPEQWPGVETPPPSEQDEVVMQTPDWPLGMLHVGGVTATEEEMKMAAPRMR